MKISTTVGAAVKVAAALSLIAGTIGLTAAVATASGQHAKPAILHRHTCTVVASGRHRHVVGRAGDVVCGLKGNDTLTAVGPGTVYLIAGRGRDRLVASNDPNAHDVLIGGSGRDTIVAGNGGDDIVDEGTGNDTVDCGSTGTVTVVDDTSPADSQGDNSQGDDNSEGDNSQGDNSQGDNQDCQGVGNVQSATLDFEGTVVAPLTSTTVTVQWSDVNDGGRAWLDSQTPVDPNPVTFDITSATVEVDGGASLAVGDDVEVAANPPSSGTTLQAVDVQAEGGDGSD